MDVPAGARDFVKKAAGTAKERSTEFHARSEKVTEAIETAVTGTVTEVAKISRNIGQALSMTRRRSSPASRSSRPRPPQRSRPDPVDMVRARSELFMTRAKVSAEYVGKLVADGAKSAQDNLAKVYGKTA